MHGNAYFNNNNANNIVYDIVKAELLKISSVNSKHSRIHELCRESPRYRPTIYLYNT